MFATATPAPVRGRRAVKGTSVRWRPTAARSRQAPVASQAQREHMEMQARIRLLEHAASELLESETNGSLVLGVRGSQCEPLVVTALGCSVLVAVGR
ncbi:MAG TPA: hypothetical protein VFV02_09505, partial [Acidimicrobiales bacterium]|nr:hypothetical protein [Acidimicrobiales bacterium]